MSRGLGRIERAIIAFVDDEDWYEDAYAAESLAIALYHPKLPLDDWWPTRAQRLSVLRAMHSLVCKYPDRFVLTGGKGREPLWLCRASALRSGSGGH